MPLILESELQGSQQRSFKASSCHDWNSISLTILVTGPECISSVMENLDVQFAGKSPWRGEASKP